MSHHRISSTDSKVRITFMSSSITDSGIERVETTLQCLVQFTFCLLDQNVVTTEIYYVTCSLEIHKFANTS